MKSFFSIVILICFSLFAKAQVAKNTILAGGSFGANSFNRYLTTQPDQKQTSQAINLALGKAIRENKVLGVSFSYGRQKFQNYSFSAFDSIKYISNSYSVGLFYHQYKALGSGFSFYGESNGAYFFGNSSENTPSGTFKNKSHAYGGSLGITPGISYGITKKLQVELSLPNIIEGSYIYYIGDPNPGSAADGNTQIFSFNSSFSNNSVLGNLAIGFRLFL